MTAGIIYKISPQTDGKILIGGNFTTFNRVKIQGRALPFVETDSIILGYRITIYDRFSFNIDKRDGLPEDLNIFLEDKELRIIHNLKEEPYFFSTQAGTFNDRFVVKYRNETLGKNEFENLENNVFVSIKDKVIKVSSAKESIKEALVFDVLGKLLYDKKRVGNKEFEVSNLVYQNQVLLVKITLENDFIIAQKIIF